MGRTFNMEVQLWEFDKQQVDDFGARHGGTDVYTCAIVAQRVDWKNNQSAAGAVVV